MNSKSKILSYFSKMKDHRLDLCGAEDWYEIEEFAEIRESWIQNLSSVIL